MAHPRTEKKKQITGGQKQKKEEKMSKFIKSIIKSNALPPFTKAYNFSYVKHTGYIDF